MENNIDTRDKTIYDIDELALRIKCLELTKTATALPSIALAKDYYSFITSKEIK